MDSRELSNMTNVQLGEARRHDEQRDLGLTLAHDIYHQAMEGF